jgi:CSLREA domain-containing protein
LKTTYKLFTISALLALTFSAIGVTPVYAATFTVTKIADTNDGTCNADCSLREAITAANAAPDADTITLPLGVYTLTFGSQLPAVASAITINGSGAANTIIQAGFSPNTATYRVFEVTSSGDLTLNSLTVRNGRCNGSCANVTDGGGGILNGGALIVSNVTFSANSSTGYGGGMYNSASNPTLTLNGVTFSGNSSTSGGGMFNSNSSPTLTNVTFSANSSTDSGGGMYNFYSSPTLTNVTFSGNYAFIRGGGMYNDIDSNPTLTTVTFSANSSTNGGGMYNYGSSPMLTDVTFSANSSTTGGGMYNYGSNPTLTLNGVTFSANSATNGGGMYNYGSSPTLTNVTFNGNSASSGGGMYNYVSSPTLTSVTFSANSATNGGGMYNDQSSPTLTNVTFSANSASSHGGGMYNVGNSPTLTLNGVTFNGNSASSNGGGMYNILGSIPTLKNTLIANSPSGGDCSGALNAASSNNLIEDIAACGLTNGVNGNIIGQDLALGALANNGGFTQTHALLAGSPAIDAGTNTGCPTTDQRGITRPQGARCDIGAYEYTYKLFLPLILR